MRAFFRKKSSKRSFMLLELVLSLVLITLCLTPMLNVHSKVQQTRLSSLAGLVAPLKAKEQFSDLKLQLFEQSLKVSKQEIKEGVSKTLESKLSGYECSCYMKQIREIKHPANTYMVAVDIRYENSKRALGPYRDYFVISMGETA
jgi:hypothetical protein